MSFKYKLLGFLLYVFYRLYCSTLRISMVNRAFLDETQGKEESSCVVAFWHDEFFPLTYTRKGIRSLAMASPSRDGDLLEGVLSRMGVKVVRGSSSRKGTQAMLETVRMVQEKAYAVCIALDGPRGPRHNIKHGALFLASKAEIPILPTRLFMEKAHVFNSWDRFQMPLPFSRVRIVYGEPFLLSADGDEEHLEKAAEELKKRMNSLDIHDFV